MKITTHTIVKNEDKWIGYSLTSIKDLVSEMLVFDDASTDNTTKIIESIGCPKIKLNRGELKTPKDFTLKRNEMVQQTKTDWFILLDGDEIWPESQFKKLLDFLENCGPEVYGVVSRTRNCVGDIYHYLPEEAGLYNFLGKRGHLTIRAYRKLPSFKWIGDYPLEAYVDQNNVPINSNSAHLKFLDVYYWHTTHLIRSSSPLRVKGWRNTRIDRGISVKNLNELPEILRNGSFPRRSFWYELLASIVTPLKLLKRKLV